MTLLGPRFFFSRPQWSATRFNAAPVITDVTLNFDLKLNTPPIGANQGLVFDVMARNAAPSVPVVVLNFDLRTNVAPTGSDQDLTFEVSPVNTPPQGQNQLLVFDVAA